MSRPRHGRVLAWTGLLLVVGLLYLPLLPPLSTSVSPTGRQPDLSDPTLRWYVELPDNPTLVGSIETSVKVAVLAGLITPLLALGAAMAVRELRRPRLVVLLLLAPLFIPGVSLGLANAFLFQQLGVFPSLFTITVIHVLWALPFAFLIVLTAMATFDPVYLEAAYVHGANRLRAFLTVELPLVWPGILGSATFSIILSFNETVRTGLVQGPSEHGADVHLVALPAGRADALDLRPDEPDDSDHPAAHRRDAAVQSACAKAPRRPIGGGWRGVRGMTAGGRRYAGASDTAEHG